MAKPVVVFSILGSTLDKGRGAKRWNHWRPTVDLCSHENLLVDRLVLLCQPASRSLSETIVQDVTAVSPDTAVEVREVAFEDPWDFEEVYATLLDFVKGEHLDPDREDYFVHITTGTHVAQICWFLLTEARFLPGRLLQTSPSPGNRSPGSFRVIDLDLSKYESLRARFDTQQLEHLSFLKAGIETRNPAFNALIAELETVVLRSRAPVLLTGPTGAGKTRLARRIYDLTHQRGMVEGPLLEVNCATLRGDQAMSTLFGHRRGAFTGAVKDRKGVLERADQGMVFLDEIGELGLDEQAMLLHALEDGRFTPLGAETEIHSRFQLIAGTNRDLRSAVAQGCFREDLLARIDLWSFELPGLAARPEDIEPNLDHELARFAGTDGRRVRFSKAARTRFVEFARGPDAPWRGNFRDLSAAVVRMGTLAPGDQITTRGVEDEIRRLRRNWARPGDASRPFPRVERALGPEGVAELDRFDLAQLEEVLAVCESATTLSAAGRQLFASSRRRKRSSNDSDRLRKYLAKFDLSFDEVRVTENASTPTARSARSKPDLGSSYFE